VRISVAGIRKHVASLPVHTVGLALLFCIGQQLGAMAWISPDMGAGASQSEATLTSDCPSSDGSPAVCDPSSKQHQSAHHGPAVALGADEVSPPAHCAAAPSACGHCRSGDTPLRYPLRI